MNKSVRWTLHAMRQAAARKLDPQQVLETIQAPELRVVDAATGRTIYTRRVLDGRTNTIVALRVFIEESELEIVVVTVYKSNRVNRYFRE